jgi:hypothetical protein
VDPQESSTARDRSSAARLAASCALLAAVIAPAALGIAWLVGGREWSDAVLASAALAGGVCFVAASMALVAVFLGNRWNAAVQGVLVGMLFRMGLPLAAVVALVKFDLPLAPRGAATTILGVYLIALVVETLLSLRMVPPAQLPRTASRKA